MSRINLILLVVLLTGLSACCKKKLYCNPDKLQIMIAGYNRLDVRNIMVKKYKIGDFKKALDSTTFVYTGSAPVVFNKKDTLDFKDYTTTSTTINGVYQGYDWDIYMAGANRENYRVTFIVDSEHRSEMVKCGDDDTKCLNAVGHFVVNGEWRNGNTLWIEKKK